ncbi:MAG: DUF1587 domain-containing protein [Pirellulaceae bacterium]
MAQWIGEGLTAARRRPVPKNGGARRLTVAQYRNTLRELLLLDDDLSDILPPDAVSRDGFVNNHETLALSPLMLETYFEIAERALQRCIVDPRTKPVIQNFRVELGAAINMEPCPDPLILGADSLLLNNNDFLVTQTTPNKPFEFTPFQMRTKYRFIEGYRGNDTVRGWREFDSIYHAVFACMRGAHGYPKGAAYSTIPEGLLLRPAIPSAELFGVESTYGPKANFKISLRELPNHGRFRVTVVASKYDDGLLLDPRDKPCSESSEAIAWNVTGESGSVMIPADGIYQCDVYHTSADNRRPELTLALGSRSFVGTLRQPAFLAVRLSAGELRVDCGSNGSAIDRIVLTRLTDDHDVAKRFASFERRVPKLGVHLGLRRDCGSTLNRVGHIQEVSSTAPQSFVFEGRDSQFPSPDVEK